MCPFSPLSLLYKNNTNKRNEIIYLSFIIILIIGGHVTQRTLSRTYTIGAFMKIRVNHSQNFKSESNSDNLRQQSQKVTIEY